MPCIWPNQKTLLWILPAMPPDASSARILFLQPTSFLGGAEKSAVELAAALSRRGFNIRFVMGGGGPVLQMAESSFAVDRVDFPYVSRLRFTGLAEHAAAGRLPETAGAVRRLRGLARNSSLVYANGAQALIYAALSCCGVPYVYHARDILKASRLAKLAARNAVVSIAVSDFVRGGLIAAGLSPVSVHTIHNGIDVSYYRSLTDRSGAKAALGLPQDAPCVLWMGSMISWKRPELFIDVAAALRSRASFVMVGGAHLPRDGPYERRVKRLAAEAGVTALSTVPDPRPFYAAADLFVSTSVDEPFGRVLVEAMVAGVPVAATASGGKPEIIESGVTGILVPPDDASALATAVRELLSSPADAETLAAAARTRAESCFTIDRCADGVVAVLRNVLA
ncbi:MAG: glycosyltransferase family 4 protein [Planctomycetes bacterium]|nr:glycosyltransferase family 4 protein [Planctomycetota bacterium]